LQQLEVYFNVHHIDEEKNIPFVRLKLEGRTLTWWEIHTKTLRERRVLELGGKNGGNVSRYLEILKTEEASC
jgi:hypothetical protein